MLTIRKIGEDGTECVREVQSVVKAPGDGKNLPFVLIVYDANGKSDQIEEGDVFVMNDNGKTIADYHMHFLRQTKFNEEWARAQVTGTVPN